MSSPSHPRHRSPAFMPLGIKAISCESTFSDFGTADFGRAEVDAAISAAVSRHCFDFFYGGGQRSSYSLRGGSCRSWELSPQCRATFGAAAQDHISCGEDGRRWR